MTNALLRDKFVYEQLDRDALKIICTGESVMENFLGVGACRGHLGVGVEHRARLGAVAGDDLTLGFTAAACWKALAFP